MIDDMTAADIANGENPDEANRTREDRDTDDVTERTKSAGDDPGDTGFDFDSPGNYVDDTESAKVPEPNEPG
jgi:hypothetical protein